MIAGEIATLDDKGGFLRLLQTQDMGKVRPTIVYDAFFDLMSAEIGLGRSDREA